MAKASKKKMLVRGQQSDRTNDLLITNPLQFVILQKVDDTG
jgi:hypothetical protein